MRERTVNVYEQRIQRVLEHVVANLERPLPLEELAALARCSPFHFHRIFRAITGESVAGLVRRLRIERAALALRGDRASVTEVAMDAGYESVEAFSRAFRRWSGMSPSAYRAVWPVPALEFPDTRVRFRAADGAIVLEPTDGGPSMDVTIEQRPATRYAYISHRGPYNEIGPAFQRLAAWLHQRRAFTTPPMCFSLSYDDPDTVPSDALRSDACFALGDAIAPEGEVQIAELPAGRYAAHDLLGPYDLIAPAYRQLFGGWLPRSGENPAERPCMELYLDDPASVPPEQLRTRLLVPLAETARS